MHRENGKRQKAIALGKHGEKTKWKKYLKKKETKNIPQNKNGKHAFLVATETRATSITAAALVVFALSLSLSLSGVLSLNLSISLCLSLSQSVSHSNFIYHNFGCSQIASDCYHFDFFIILHKYLYKYYLLAIFRYIFNVFVFFCYILLVFTKRFLLFCLCFAQIAF